jgi:hypothetical protein
MNRSNISNGQPERKPMTVRAEDLLKLADRLEGGTADAYDLLTTARVVRWSIKFVGKSSVSV